MATAPAGFSLGAVAPEDALAAFAARRLLRPSFRWQDVWQAEHARAFAVAGVLRLDVLQTIRTEVQRAVAEGLDLNTFRERLRPLLVAKGFWGKLEITDPETGELRTTRFNNQRLALIFDVNMRQSHAAGRWARGMRGTLPLILYRTMGDERVRVSHQAWDWICLPREHPWWDTHTPPNGWRCRCYFMFIDQAGVAKLQRAGKKIRFEPPPEQWVPFTNRSTGQVQRVPAGIDPGFAYNPGKVHVGQAAERLERGLASAGDDRTAPDSASTSHQLQRAVIKRGRAEEAFEAFITEPPPQDVGMPVAAVPPRPATPAATPTATPEPTVASVSALDLRAQLTISEFPRTLPATVAQWALAQAVLDTGQRLDLGDGLVLWWVRHGSSVLVMELQRSALVWWVRALQTLTRDEALARYPELQAVLA